MFRDGYMENQLEGLIDAHGMFKVLAAIYNVCTDKASHLAENWQDDETSRAWQNGANTLDNAISYPNWPL
jgi:hypothetical protein